MRHRRLGSFATLALLLLLAGPRVLLAQGDERAPGWYDQAELAFVLTGGNTRSTVFGLKNTLERVFPDSKLTFKAGGLQVKSGDKQRTAIGTAGDFEVVEDVNTETTAENYYGNLRFDRDLSERSYLYALGGWVRNRFSGIENAWTGAAGIGWKLIETERTQYQADIGGTITSEEQVIGDKTTFGGLRFTWDLTHQLTETTKFTSGLVVDENLKDTEDLRFDFDNAVAVDISKLLALKSGLLLRFDNQPSLQEVDLLAAPGGPVTGTVLTPLDKLDTQFTVALIVKMD